MLAFEEFLGKDYVEKFRQGPFPTITFPDIDILSQGFPRDLWTMLSNGTVMMDLNWHRLQAKFDRKCHAIDPTYIREHGIVDSVYGEGGRLLQRGSLAVVFDEIEMPCLETMVAMAENRFLPKPGPVDHLLQQGLEVLELPAVSSTFKSERTSRVEFGVDNHIDRFFALIEDSQGGLHLLADPLLWSGYQSQTKPPKYGPDQTLKECRRRALKAGIGFHRVKFIHRPLAIGVYQTQEGVVVMSSDEPELQEVIAGLVGPDKVLTSEEPLYKYGAWFYSGIHCLINEAPDYFATDPPRVIV
jgi:hypothetical protein